MLARKLRARVEQLESVVESLRGLVGILDTKLVAAEAQRTAYERALLISDERHDRLLSTHGELVKSFQKVADQYTDGLTRARVTISELSDTAQALSQPLRNSPLHMSEEEEDLEFQLDHGVIDMSQYNEALRAAGLADD